MQRDVCAASAKADDIGLVIVVHVGHGARVDVEAAPAAGRGAEVGDPQHRRRSGARPGSGRPGGRSGGGCRDDRRRSWSHRSSWARGVFSVIRRRLRTFAIVVDHLHRDLAGFGAGKGTAHGRVQRPTADAGGFVLCEFTKASKPLRMLSRKASATSVSPNNWKERLR